MSTSRFIVNKEEMDEAQVDVPGHISVSDSGLGYGAKCLIVSCGGTAIDEGVKAFKKVYPNLKVTALRSEAARMLREM